MRVLCLLALTVVLSQLTMTSCKVYSFTGASVDPNIKTVTIESFTNQSPNGNTRFSQDLTDQLKDKLLSETNLNIIRSGGDIEFKGAITGYDIKGQAATAEETTAINRLTITVRVEYINRQDEKENWARSFTRYDDYESTENLADVEDDLVTNINAQLVEEIFNQAFANW